MCAIQLGLNSEVNWLARSIGSIDRKNSPFKIGLKYPPESETFA